MHIADITALYAPESGGVRRYLHAKRDWLAQRPAYRHTLLVPGARVAVPSPGVVHLPSMPLPNRAGYRLPLGHRAAARALCTVAPNIIEAGDPYWYAAAALAAARRLNVPAIAFCHSDVHSLVRRWAGALPAAVVARYLRHIYRPFTRVLAASDVVLDHLREIGIDNAVRQPLGVDTGLFHPRLRDRDIRARLGLAPQTRLLVFAGRFAAEKNMWVLEQALRRLGPPYVLLAIGGGPHRPRGANVITLPFESSARALARWLASADALVHAGDQETFGLVALEAMACGLPVVCADAGGIRELIDDEVGIRVRPRDPRAMAEGIDALFAAHPGTLGARARERAVARFDWNAVMPDIVAHYRAAHHAVAARRIDPAPIRQWRQS